MPKLDHFPSHSELDTLSNTVKSKYEKAQVRLLSFITSSIYPKVQVNTIGRQINGLCCEVWYRVTAGLVQMLHFARSDPLLMQRMHAQTGSAWQWWSFGPVVWSRCGQHNNVILHRRHLPFRGRVESAIWWSNEQQQCVAPNQT